MASNNRVNGIVPYCVRPSASVGRSVGWSADGYKPANDLFRVYELVQSIAQIRR